MLILFVMRCERDNKLPDTAAGCNILREASCSTAAPTGSLALEIYTALCYYVIWIKGSFAESKLEIKA